MHSECMLTRNAGTVTSHAFSRAFWRACDGWFDRAILVNAQFLALLEAQVLR